MAEIKDKDHFKESDPYYYASKTLLSRWKPQVLQAIRADGSTRFSRFRKQMPISEKMLGNTLRELEADGLIEKHVISEVPPRVEYILTGHGKQACELLDQIYGWARGEMIRSEIEIDKLAEMWHGYCEPDQEFMDAPYKEYNKKKWDEY